MNNLKKVHKRNNSYQDFDISKIKAVITWAIGDLPLNQLDLEQNISGIFQDCEKTENIQKKLIISATSLVDINTPETFLWNKVAGRLALMNLYKSSAVSRNHTYLDYNPDFVGYVKNMVELGIYDERLITEYTEKELEKAGKFINPKYDLDFSISAIQGLIGKILVKYDGNMWELPQEHNLICALMLNIYEQKDKRLELVNDTYKAISERKISLATPMYAGLGLKGASLASCFIQQPEDSLDGIQYNEAIFGRISKRGGASGYSLHKIRGKHSPVAGYKNASGGIAPWENILNSKCVAINQTGRRQGAITPAVPVYHRDIIEHLDIQEEAGDIRKKAYDVSPQITIPDEFMERVQTDADWYLFCPYELKEKLSIELDEVFGTDFKVAYNQCIEAYESGIIENVEKLKARFILNKIITAWHTTGYPTVTFSDEVNRLNPNNHIGNIPNANLCQESFGPVLPSSNFTWELNSDNTATEKHDVGLIHVCNLMSVNLYNAMNDLEHIVSLTVRILDNTIDLSVMQSPEAERYNKNLRTIGVGILGLADYLAKKHISWNSDKIFSEIDFIFAKISGIAYKADIEIAKEKGAYNYYKGSKFDRSIVFGKDKTTLLKELYDKSLLDARYTELYKIWGNNFDNLNKYGMRNASVLAVAPTTSSSLIQEVSAGVTPVFKRAFKEKNAITTCIVVPPEIEKGNVLAPYQSQRDLNQAMLYKIVGVMQKWIDQGISFELNWDQNKEVSAQDYVDVLFTAWREKCKTIYYHRHITKTINDLDEKQKDDLCVGCAG